MNERKKVNKRAISKRKQIEIATTRLAACQALYQMGIAQTSVDQIFAQFKNRQWRENALGKDIADIDEQFFSDLISGVLAHQSGLDNEIAEHLEKSWRLERLQRLVLSILRTGSFEIIHHPQINTNHIMTDYIAIGEAFFDDRERRFIHALLDKQIKKHRPYSIEK